MQFSIANCSFARGYLLGDPASADDICTALATIADGNMDDGDFPETNQKDGEPGN